MSLLYTEDRSVLGTALGFKVYSVSLDGTEILVATSQDKLASLIEGLREFGLIDLQKNAVTAPHIARLMSQLTPVARIAALVRARPTATESGYTYIPCANCAQHGVITVGRNEYSVTDFGGALDCLASLCDRGTISALLAIQILRDALDKGLVVEARFAVLFAEVKLQKTAPPIGHHN